ncbi:uncharacterized protein J3R85_012485 [Psidium guajava]|nr:uncharacterized protein J3R85_012485 [Psidium guajava]
MYKRGGHMRGAVSQRRPASSACSTSSPSLSSSPLLTSNPQQLRTDGQHGHIGPSFDPQEHIMGGLGHMHTESPSVSIPPVPISPIPSPLVPSPSIQQSNDEENTGEEDTRFIIGPYGDSFTNATSVVRQLNKIINNYWRGEWISYSSAPKEVKNLWWNEFKRKFRWDEIEEEEIKRIFKKKAGDHIRNVINRAKTRQVKPDFITGDSWTEMNKTWENERNKQRSEQNKKNRSSTSSEGSATYAGGSITVGEHKKRMVPPVPPTNEIGDGHNAERHNDDEIAADDDYDLVSRFIN